MRAALALEAEDKLDIAEVLIRDPRAHGVAARLRSGRVGINAHTATHYTMPMGGFRESGWGRENGLFGLEAHLETKSVFQQTSRGCS